MAPCNWFSWHRLSCALCCIDGSSSMCHTGLGGSRALPWHAAGQHCPSGSALSCIVTTAVPLWPEGTQLGAAGQLWILLAFPFLCFISFPSSFLCSTVFSSSFCFSLCRSLCVPVLTFLSSLFHPGTDAQLAPWSLGTMEPRTQPRLIGMS